VGKSDHKSEGRAGSLTLVAGDLALNFANTESGRGGDHHLNHLKSAADVLTWAQHADVIKGPDAERGHKLIQEQKQLADSFFRRAASLRQAVYELNACLVKGIQPREDNLEVLAGHYCEALSHGKLRSQERRYAWSWRSDDDLAAAVLGPIAEAAINLLTRQDKSRIKQCGGNHCGWLFFDTSKNNSRCWCDMRVCGNRSKVKAMRARKRQATEPEIRSAP
jgi:predicted RNA-binding Zn ribbon-like protein